MPVTFLGITNYNWISKMIREKIKVWCLTHSWQLTKEGIGIIFLGPNLREKWRSKELIKGEKFGQLLFVTPAQPLIMINKFFFSNFLI